MSENDKISFQSAKFGDVTVDKSNIVTFPQGLPGFERFTRFGLFEVEEETPFLRLLCVDEPNLGFVLVNPVVVWPEYEPNVGEDEFEGLGINSVENLAIYCIVTLSKIPEQVTANLKGPICINTGTMVAKQMILADDEYNTKHSILAAGKQ